MKRMRGMFGSLFPQKYDFVGMLVEQAENTVTGMEAYIAWVNQDIPIPPDNLIKIGGELDVLRYTLEARLMEAFSTPFSRQDIYTLSRNIDYVMDYAVEIAREMYAFDVNPDEHIRAMSLSLLYGTRYVVEGTRYLGMEKAGVEVSIRNGRMHIHAIEDTYIACMADLFKTDDVMDAMKKREIYYLLRNAGKALSVTLDIIHKSVVGQA
ncbi:MAG: DUF47 domain-containing protein [Methanomicrobiales archaeon]|nr:DUF47 domain-containing protein [Methanomicrobiales archaeon]